MCVYIFVVCTAAAGARDEDTVAMNVTFTVTPENVNNRRSPIGFFSRLSRPNAPTLTFTQQDIIEGQILFTHSAGKMTMMSSCKKMKNFMSQQKINVTLKKKA